MNIRPFDWRDLPTIHRYRKQGLFLDSSLLLTRRPSLIPTGALLNYFAPTTGIFTYVCDHNDQSSKQHNGVLVGQVTHTAGMQAARMSFLAPESYLREDLDIEPLIERMAIEVADHGGMFILAEVYENHPAFELLRRSGFAIYARQRFWQLNVPSPLEQETNCWRSCTDKDTIAIRSLYANLVPGLVQQVEPLTSERFKGLVCYQNQDLKGFIEIKSGPRGILAQPYIHPDAKDLPSGLIPILESLPERGNRPVYQCVRTYQSWLEVALYDLEAQPSPQSAVMVKHLAASQRVEHSFARQAIERTQAEPVARIHLTDPESK